MVPPSNNSLQVPDFRRIHKRKDPKLEVMDLEDHM